MDLRVPMVFGLSSASSETEVTRSVNLEDWKNNFKVGTWKSYTTTPQNVMNGYRVVYDANNNPKWYYENVNSQILRYWDLSAFPYDFRAVAPDITGAKIASDQITINAASNPFKAQSYINNVYKDNSGNEITNPEEEVCLVSHVTRTKNGTNYEDEDVIKDAEINTTSKGVATRGVHMPFHHLVSKIGFRLFINDPQPTSPDYKVKMNSVKITVLSDVEDIDFISQSKTYTATDAQGLGTGTFSDNTTHTTEYTLLEHGEYKVSGTDINFREHLNQQTAIDLCTGSATTHAYLQQIPQNRIKLRVQLKMETDHVTAGSTDSSTQFEFDQWLTLESTDTTVNPFIWAPDTRYIYYLHIPNLHGHEINLNTCEILPWDEVQTTDIDIEL